MAQMNWIYLDGAGSRHKVGLYHGDRSGHVVIYCNLKVVQVDFSVKSTQVYSFFIEDEFCEIHIVKEKDGSFGYAFKVNKEVDTPRNRERKVVNRIERKHVAMAIGGIILFVAGALLFNQYQNNRRIQSFVNENSLSGNLSADEIRQIRSDGHESVATFFILQKDRQQKMYYTFPTADSMQITGTVVGGNSAFVLPNGFELADRDQFAVRYLPGSPKIHRVDFFEPKAKTLQNYVAAAIAKEQQMHPDKSPAFCKCLVETVYQQKTWLQLATIYHQTNGHTKQDKYLQDQYLRLVRDPELDRVIRERCGGK
jgi:hypothetical protein